MNNKFNSYSFSLKNHSLLFHDIIAKFSTITTSVQNNYKQKFEIRNYAYNRQFLFTSKIKPCPLDGTDGSALCLSIANNINDTIHIVNVNAQLIISES